MDISTEKWMERLIYGEIDSSIAFDRLMVFGGILWEYNRKRCLPCRQKKQKGVSCRSSRPSLELVTGSN